MFHCSTNANLAKSSYAYIRTYFMERSRRCYRIRYKYWCCYHHILVLYFQLFTLKILLFLEYSERREFATAAGECQPCHSECKVQEGKQTCTGSVWLVCLTAATYRQYCFFSSLLIFFMSGQLFTSEPCFSVFASKGSRQVQSLCQATGRSALRVLVSRRPDGRGGGHL